MRNDEPRDVERAIADAHRREWAVVVAATAYAARDLDVAEECAQEAFAEALTAWNRDGIPRNSAAWLTAVAKRRAVDALRREMTWRRKMPLLLEPDDGGEDERDRGESIQSDLDDVVVDERLRLIFMCCHPALAPEAQMALTLRLVCGMPTPDIARVFLVSETTMGARLTRAKKKISTARIPMRVPSAAQLPDRLRAVLGVIYLLFTMGHTSGSGESAMRAELVDEALRLTGDLQQLMPDEREVRGLLALLLVTDARRFTRVGVDGELLSLQDQDRSRWDSTAIARAKELITDGVRTGRPSRYLLEGAIALQHATAPSFAETDWLAIVRLYDALLREWPSPVVALNRAVAVSMVDGPAPALGLVEELEKDARLSDYHYLPAIKADLLGRLGQSREAAVEVRRALDRTDNELERDYLRGQLQKYETET